MTATDRIEILPGTPMHPARIADLVWSTGPSSYAYIFGDRTRFDHFVGRSWQTPETYFGHTEAMLAVHDGEIVGLEIGFVGVRTYRTRAKLASVATALIEEGTLTAADVAAVAERADKASYLNPLIPESAYYVLALAVVPELRGAGVGRRFLTEAVERGRHAGCRTLHLDVLSDNRAVDFYRIHGLVTMAETIAPEPFRTHGVPMEMRMVLPLQGGNA
jgi:ribosomal protein S18 acetylase RimI-like enzyme